MNHRHIDPTRSAGLVSAGLLASLLAACALAPETTDKLDLGDEVIITDFALAPPDARPDACYGKDVTPGVIEHVTERVLVAEAQFGADGNVLVPPQYEERKTQKLVTGREPIYFETPCPPRWTPDFIASIQRALKTRGIYTGAVSGTLDAQTRAAIRAYQVGRGLNSAILSTESARELGLVEVDLPG
ncbi:MAG: peptidoglycan-binding protein [Maritimibacter sp.]|nr:peptidoglycan-binding protein [Maritimibacter sp.]